MNKCNRRGNTLIYFVFFFLIVFGLGTLVIDIGLAQLTRRQLQTAVNTAAKEVLYDVDSNNDGMGDGRENARRFVRAVFDDDFDSTTIDALNLGAGPDVPYYDGYQLSGDFRASRRYYLPDDPDIPTGRSPVGVYKPDLALNPGDDPAGDIVPGTFNEIESDPAKTHEEQVDYSRDDFTPGSGDAVLVRMRRTGEGETFTDPSAGTSGPPVPFIFGRGLLSAGSSEFLSRIERGTYVRATAIADTRPARRVGVGFTTGGQNMLGLVNIQIELDDWQAAGTGGTISQLEMFDISELKPTSIGENKFSSVQVALPVGRRGYVSIWDSTNDNRIVGFGLVTVDSSTTVVREPLPSGAVLRNTSSIPTLLGINLTGVDVARLFAENSDLVDDHGGLTAVSMVRSTE